MHIDEYAQVAPELVLLLLVGDRIADTGAEPSFKHNTATKSAIYEHAQKPLQGDLPYIKIRVIWPYMAIYMGHI